MEHKNVKITASDKTSAVGLADALQHGGEIEGKAKIILTDEHTGKREIIEHKNLVTNSVKRIFGYNWMMNADVSALIPMEKLFGGILCFQNTFADPTADTVYCPNEDENPMIACAGDQAHATLNPYRGNPNALASSISSDLSSMTKVWEWQTLQGNGTISSLALTSAVCGNMGLKPIDDEFCPINTASNISSDAYMFADENQSSTQVNAWTPETARKRPLWIDRNNPRYGYTVALVQKRSTWGGVESIQQDIVAIKMEQAFLKTSMFSGINEYKEISRTVVYSSPDFLDRRNSSDLSGDVICEYGDYVYFVRVFTDEDNLGYPTDSIISVMKISKVDWSRTSARYNVTEALKEFTGTQHPRIWTMGIQDAYFDNITDCWIMQNALPTENGKILVNASFGSTSRSCGLWIPFDHNPSASEMQIVDNISYYSRTADIRRGNNNSWSPSAIKLGNGIYVMVDATRAYFINGSKAYPCGIPARPNGHYTSTVSPDPDGIVLSTPETFPSMMFSSFSKSGRLKTRSGFCHSNVYLATINNLENSVEKQNTMSMRIEYSLTVT